MLAWKLSCLALVYATTAILAHVEDLCINPPDASPPGVYNFFSFPGQPSCGYLDTDSNCLPAMLKNTEGFNDTSTCRGAVHFNAVYFIAVSLGFKGDYAYQMAAFSQAIDFNQYRGVDSCGQNMAPEWWTPPMRGLLRTWTKFGGTASHLGAPFVGLFDEFPHTPLPEDADQAVKLYGPPLEQSQKKYNGGSDKGCSHGNYTQPLAFYMKTCPGLIPTVGKPPVVEEGKANPEFEYEGGLNAKRRWAMGETDLLCIGGYTAEDPETGSLFTGKECPKQGGGYQVDVGVIEQGPIPLSSNVMDLGEQVIHFTCFGDPECAGEDPMPDPSSYIYASQFGEYITKQSDEHGYARVENGTKPVPELIARFGIYLHWIADRSSHWFCTDSGQSGMVGERIKNEDGTSHYNLLTYLSKEQCEFVGHGFMHYWEQGMATSLTPGSYGAIASMYNEAVAFRQRNIKEHPEWFEAVPSVLDFDTVIGTEENPGIIYQIIMIPEAKERFQAELNWLEKLGLPPMKGFEADCPAAEPTSLSSMILAKLLKK